MKYINLKIIIILTVIYLPSCKNELEEKNKEITLLKSEIKSKDSIITLLYVEKLALKSELNEKKVIKLTDSDVLSTFNSHMEFYKPNCKFRNLKIRKQNDNNFDISCEVKIIDEYVQPSYEPAVYRITYTEEGTKYKLIMRSGPVMASV